jgi:ADP-ribose pyrophosphatase
MSGWPNRRSNRGTTGTDTNRGPAKLHKTRAYAAGVARQQGGWQTFGEQTIYGNRWVRLGVVDVEAPHGERWDYHVVHLNRIAIALIVDHDRALMLWRYRFVTDQWGYELLGGLVEDGEEAAATAAREAEEESGWRPLGEPERLVSFEPLPGQVTAPVDVFLWRGAEQIGEPTDTEEVGRVEWVPLSRVPELAQRQELLGSGTLVALLYYLASRGGASAAG